MVFPPDKAQVTQCWQADAEMMRSFSVRCIRKGGMMIGPLASEFSLDHLAQVGVCQISSLQSHSLYKVLSIL